MLIIKFKRDLAPLSKFPIWCTSSNTARKFLGGNQPRLASISLATAQQYLQTIIVANRLLTKSHVHVRIVI